MLALFQISASTVCAEAPDSISTSALSFGENSFGQTGVGTASGVTLIATPIDMTNVAGKTITQVAANEYNSLLLASDGTVFSFGRNWEGQSGLGIGSDTSTLIATPINTSNLGGKKISQVSVGVEHSLLLSNDGYVYSFGRNNVGQTGLGTTSGFTTVATPIDTTNLSGKVIKQVAAGFGFSLLLTDDGDVFSFGANADGRTGLGTTVGISSTATSISATTLGDRKIVQIAAGAFHSLLVADDGTVFSFGWNDGGRTGLGLTSGNTPSAAPINTSNLEARKIVQVSAANHSLLLADDGKVFSFGRNDYGENGQGSGSGLTVVATPIDMTNVSVEIITHVSAGSSHSLFLTENGTVFSCGQNFWGQTGVGTTSGFTSIATAIATTNLIGLRVIGISAGSSQSLLLAVPEPGAITLVLLGGLPLLVTRNRTGWHQLRSVIAK